MTLEHRKTTEEPSEGAGADAPFADDAAPMATTTTTTYQQEGEMSSWAVEGMRRIKEEQVYRRMTFLTGMAAIGGFLFGTWMTST